MKQNLFWLGLFLVLTIAAFFLGKSQQFRSEDPINESSEKLETQESWVDVYDKDRNFSGAINKLKNQLSKSNKLVKLLSQDRSGKSGLPSKSNLSTSEKISGLVDGAEDSEIDFYLEQYFPEKILEVITDKRTFSKRLLEEYTEAVDPEKKTIHGEILFSVASAFPNENVINYSLKKRQTMVAHIETDGSLEPTDQVFIRWLRVSDNKVLLYQNVLIRESSNRNWVTLTPKSDWQLGSYLVTIYSFDNDLSVIAQNIYDIDYVE